MTLMDNNKVMNLDIRLPIMPVGKLDRYGTSVDVIAWSPQSNKHIYSSGDDTHALIWELPTVIGPNEIDPLSMYPASSEINQL